jgi:hypothetical protein
VRRRRAQKLDFGHAVRLRLALQPLPTKKLLVRRIPAPDKVSSREAAFREGTDLFEVLRPQDELGQVPSHLPLNALSVWVQDMLARVICHDIHPISISA